MRFGHFCAFRLATGAHYRKISQLQQKQAFSGLITNNNYSPCVAELSTRVWLFIEITNYRINCVRIAVFIAFCLRFMRSSKIKQRPQKFSTVADKPHFYRVFII